LSEFERRKRTFDGINRINRIKEGEKRYVFLRHPVNPVNPV